VKSIKYLLLNLALVKAVAVQLACNIEQPTQPMSYFPLHIFFGRRVSSEAAGGAMEHLGDLLSYMFPDGFKWRGRAYVGASPPWFPPPPGVYALRPLQRGHSRRPELCAAPVSASSRRETLEGWRPGAVGKIVHVGLEEVTRERDGPWEGSQGDLVRVSNGSRRRRASHTSHLCPARIR
jgi:hypothetical protein